MVDNSTLLSMENDKIVHLEWKLNREYAKTAVQMLLFHHIPPQAAPGKEGSDSRLNLLIR